MDTSVFFSRPSYGSSRQPWPLSLNEAIESGQIESISYLIHLGCGINQQDGRGMSPLHLASKMNWHEVLKQLIEKGAALNTVTQQGAPLHLAVEYGHKESVALLIKGGANINISSKKQATPLYIAAEKGYLEIVLLLLHAGAEVDKGNQFKETPLKIAIQKATVDHNLRLRLNKNPLQMAVQKDRFKIVNALITFKANVNAEDRLRITPLIEAVNNNSVSIVKKLIERGADVNTCFSFKRTPLHLAFQRGERKIIQILVENGADIYAQNREYKRPSDFLHHNAQVDKKCHRFLRHAWTKRMQSILDPKIHEQDLNGFFERLSFEEETTVYRLITAVQANIKTQRLPTEICDFIIKLYVESYVIDNVYQTGHPLGQAHPMPNLNVQLSKLFTQNFKLPRQENIEQHLEPENRIIPAYLFSKKSI